VTENGKELKCKVAVASNEKNGSLSTNPSRTGAV
jgi:hypothetical protein